MNNINLKKINKVKNDDFPTPKILFEELINFINKEKPELIQNKIIYEPFYCDGKSGEILQGLTNNPIIHQDIDFFEYVNKLKYDLILTNPPFSKIQNILKEIKDKKAILLIPLATINRVYFQNYVGCSSIKLTKPVKWGNYKGVFPIQLIWLFMNCNLEKQIYSY